MEIVCSSDIICPTDLKFLYGDNFVRAGIIPYMVDDIGMTYVLLGLSNDDFPVWSDLGGRAEKGESVIETAIREFGEESRYVIPITLDRISKIIITDVYRMSGTSPGQVIFIVQVDPTLYNANINDIFIRTVPKNQYEDEMSELRWILYDHVINMNPNNLSRAMKEVQKVLKQL
jgi:8-oxo-dGTP pyrophosphatase MutT (NUDIX family)